MTDSNGHDDNKGPPAPFMGSLIPANMATFGRQIQETRQQLGPVFGGQTFIKLSQDNGEWTAGQGANAVTLQEGARYIIPPVSLTDGFIAWRAGAIGAGQPLGQVMRFVTSEPPLAEPPPIPGANRWDKQIGFSLVCIHGDDAGKTFTFMNSSGGAKKMFDNLLVAFGRQSQNKPTHMIPTVTLSSNSYLQGGVRQVWNPILHMGEWLSEAEAAAEVSAITQTAAAPAPAPSPPPPPPPPPPPRRPAAAARAPAAPKTVEPAPMTTRRGRGPAA